MFKFLIFIFFISQLSVSHSKTFNIALSITPLSAPVVIAKELGYFKKQGVNVNLSSYIGGNRAATALLDNKVDFSTSSEAVVMFKSFKYNDFVVVSTFVESNNDVKILVSKKSGIRSIKDLSNKRIATIIGTSAHFFLDHTLLMNAVDPQSVEVIAINPEETVLALKSGKVDAVASWEPFIYEGKKKLGEDAFIIPHNKLYTETFNLLVKKNFANQNIHTLNKILIALQQSITYITNKPEETQQTLSKYFKLDLSFIQDVWSDFDFNLSLKQSLITTLESEARWAVERGFIKGNAVTNFPNYLDYLFLPPLKSIHPEAVTIIE